MILEQKLDYLLIVMPLGSVKQPMIRKIFHNHIVLSVLFLYNHNHITNKKTGFIFCRNGRGILWKILEQF